MKSNELFASVSVRCPIDQYKFIYYFNQTVDEINLMYPLFTPLQHMNSFLDEREYPDILHGPISDNILFLAGFGDQYKSEFLRKMKYVFCAWWKMKQKKNGIIKRGDC